MSMSFLNCNLVVATKLTYKLQKHAGVGTKWVSVKITCIVKGSHINILIYEGPEQSLVLFQSRSDLTFSET